MRMIERFPFWLRATHWLNMIFLTGMMWSGILIYWANRVYTPFIDPGVWKKLGIAYRLAEGLSWHFALAWLFAINGVIYVGGLILTGEWRQVAPRASDFRDALLVTLHDVGIRRGPLPPSRGKLNAAQRFAYAGVIAMGAGSLATGLAIYKPYRLNWLTWAFGGYEFARLLHFALTLGYLGFIVAHVAQVARAGWNTFRAMVAGFETEP